MDEERRSTDEIYSSINGDQIIKSINEDKSGFRDDFAQALALNAGQYHEEDNYLDIDLS